MLHIYFYRKKRLDHNKLNLLSPALQGGALNSPILIKKDYSKFISKIIDGEVVLIPLDENGDEEVLYILSDAVSIRIWDLIDGHRGIIEIAQIISKEFNAEEKRVEEDLIKFLKELQKLRMINIFCVSEDKTKL